MLSLEDLTRPLTTNEVRDSIYGVLSAVGLSTTTWKPGAWPRTVITGASIVISAFSELNAKVAKSGFLATAEGVWLDLKAHYDYDVDREEAAFATGEVTLVNSAGGIYNLDPGDLVVSNSTTGKTYRNTESIALGALATLENVSIIATEAGSASTSAPGTIDELETTLNGVSVTNPSSVVGLDAELDPALRSRCTEKLGSLSPFGPWDAYAFAAKSAVRADGQNVGVTRTGTEKDGYGNLTVYVATATGEVTGDADDLDTDLGLVNEAIQTLAAPLAVTAHTESAVAVVIPITYQLWMYNTSGLTAAQVSAAVEANITTFMSSEPLGGNVIGGDSGKVFHSAIEAAISSTRYPADAPTPLPIFRVVVSTPAGDTSLAANEVPVPGIITPTINLVSVPRGP